MTKYQFRWRIPGGYSITHFVEVKSAAAAEKFVRDYVKRMFPSVTHFTLSAPQIVT